MTYARPISEITIPVASDPLQSLESTPSKLTPTIDKPNSHEESLDGSPALTLLPAVTPFKDSSSSKYSSKLIVTLKAYGQLLLFLFRRLIRDRAILRTDAEWA